MIRPGWLTRPVMFVLASVLIVASAGVACAVVRALRQPAPERPATVKVLQYNVQGAIRDASSARPDQPGVSDDDDFRFVDVLAKRIIAEKPQIVTLQEVCASQLNLLVGALEGSYPMTRAGAALKPHRDCPGSENDPAHPTDGVGAAILTVGTATQVPASPRILCTQWGQDGGVRVCTAQLDPLNSPQDMTAVTSTLDPATDQLPVIVTGDFNVEPRLDITSAMYASDVRGGDTPGRGRFYEADMCDGGASEACADQVGHTRGGASTWCGACVDGIPGGVYTKKIDYIFADIRHFEPDMTARVESTEGACPARCSDHAMLWGEVTLSPDDDLAQCGEVAHRFLEKYAEQVRPFEIELLACENGYFATKEHLPDDIQLPSVPKGYTLVKVWKRDPNQPSEITYAWNGDPNAPCGGVLNEDRRRAPHLFALIRCRAGG